MLGITNSKAELQHLLKLNDNKKIMKTFPQLTTIMMVDAMITHDDDDNHDGGAVINKMLE